MFSVELLLDMRLNKATKHRLKIFYILFAIVIAAWLIFVINNYWQSQAKEVASTNNAELVAVNNGLQNLPKPADIAPGKTSGNLSPTVSSYLAAQKSINNSSNNLSDAYIFNAGFSAFKISSINDSAKSELALANSILDRAYNALTITQKFIEYNPAIDLKPIIAGEESGSDERLTRTQQGIQQILNELNASDIPYKNDLVAIISPLEPKVMLITPYNVSAWQQEVLAAQKAIIKIISDDFNSSINSSSANISKDAASYLEL